MTDKQSDRAIRQAAERRINAKREMTDVTDQSPIDAALAVDENAAKRPMLDTAAGIDSEAAPEQLLYSEDGRDSVGRPPERMYADLGKATASEGRGQASDRDQPASERKQQGGRVEEDTDAHLREGFFYSPPEEGDIDLRQDGTIRATPS